MFFTFRQNWSGQKLVHSDLGFGCRDGSRVYFALGKVTLQANDLALLQMLGAPEGSIVPCAYAIGLLLHLASAGLVAYAEREDQVGNRSNGV